ncbi:MAG: hypothetical protein ACP5XB_22625, partial [Isosphaeraceae bacterium]
AGRGRQIAGKSTPRTRLGRTLAAALLRSRVCFWRCPGILSYAFLGGSEQKEGKQAREKLGKARALAMVMTEEFTHDR